MRTRCTLLLPLLAGLTLGGAAPALAQDPDFKTLIERGEYEALGEKLKPYLNLDKADPKLRRYLEMNLEFLARGAKASSPGEEIILFRGMKNDASLRMPASSGGDALLLPNSIRYMRKAYDKRLPRIDGYFREATSLMGGNGDELRELERIIEHHKGGGLGTNANSVKSVLISASTRPIEHFGPPYTILKVAPERAIFNHKGLTGEYEVLLPFWVLPTEVVAKVNTYQELIEHPLYQQSKYKDLQVRSYGYGAGGESNTWEVIENNIRNGRTPLEGVAGLNSYFPGAGPRIGPVAAERDVLRFGEKVGNHGGVVEWVGVGDPRLPAGAQARTYVVDGAPKVLLRRGEPVMKFALLDELTHVLQLERMLKNHPAREVEALLLKAHLGDPQARDVVNRWEIRAKKLIRGMLDVSDPSREVLTRSIKALEKEIDPFAALRRPKTQTIDWKKATRQVGGGLVHFTLSLFLKELAMVAKTGDRLLIEEFFDGLLGTDFYVHYGLFSVGAAGGDMAYAAFLERYAKRFIKPTFVRSVMRSSFSLAIGMALPDLVTGRFEGRAFAISLSGLALSSTAVKAGVAGIKWVSRLKSVSGGARISERLVRLGRAARASSVAGFVYHVLETAVVLYFGDAISQEIDSALERRRIRARVEAAIERVIDDPKGEGVRANLDELAAAYREHRDMLTAPVRDVEAVLWKRLGTIAETVKKGEDGLRRYRTLLEQDPTRYSNLAPYVEAIAARNESEYQEAVAAAMKAYDDRAAPALREAYGEVSQASDPPASASWVLRGARTGDALDPFSGRDDWLALLARRTQVERVVDWATRVPSTRLASYEHEASVYDALARAHADDPMAAAEFARLAAATRELRDTDRAVALGEGPGVGRHADAGQPDPVVAGFAATLDSLGE